MKQHEINGNTPANSVVPGTSAHETGMTKREAFAMAAMQGMLSRATQLDPADTSDWAFMYADALLKAGEK